MFGSNSRQQSITLKVCREVMEPADSSSSMAQAALYLTLWSAEMTHGLDHRVGNRTAPQNRRREMNKGTDRASCRKEDERRENAIECSGSILHELYGTVLDVVALGGSRKLKPRRWKVDIQMAAANNWLRDGERGAAGGSSVQW
jgi:hypothetical protein